MSKPTKLIVLMAFNRDEEGELQPAFDPREMPSEEKARMEARMMAGSGKFAGVVAWSRSADPNLGEYGEPVELFRAGEVPEME